MFYEMRDDLTIHAPSRNDGVGLHRPLDIDEHADKRLLARFSAGNQVTFVRVWATGSNVFAADQYQAALGDRHIDDLGVDRERRLKKLGNNVN